MTLFFQITCPYWIYFGAPVISSFKNNINYRERLAALKDAISKKPGYSPKTQETPCAFVSQFAWRDPR